MVVISIKALVTLCVIVNYLAVINILINNREIVIFVYSFTKLFVLLSFEKLSYMSLQNYLTYLALQNYVWYFSFAELSVLV